MDDAAGLRASLVTPGRGVRALLCVPDNVDSSLAASVAKSLAAIGTETQTLLHAQAKGLGTGAFELHAPADMSGPDQVEFALALSDVVLKSDGSEPQLERAALSLQKPVVQLGQPLPRLFPSRSITSGLDPERPGRLSNRQWLLGRLEQTIIEIFAFGWRGWDKEGRTESTTRLKQCFQSGWKARPYFAPEEWRKIDLLAHRIVDFGERREIEVLAQQFDELRAEVVIERLDQVAGIGFVQLSDQRAQQAGIAPGDRVRDGLDERRPDRAVLIAQSIRRSVGGCGDVLFVGHAGPHGTLD